MIARILSNPWGLFALAIGIFFYNAFVLELYEPEPECTCENPRD